MYYCVKIYYLNVLECIIMLKYIYLYGTYPYLLNHKLKQGLLISYFDVKSSCIGQR